MYNIFPQFIFRTPLLPFCELESLLKDRDSLLQAIRDPKIQEAIYISSPVLFKEIQKIIKGRIINQKEKDRIVYSIERYISRMSTRCTPFGLFAGCGIGTIGDSTSIILDNSINRVTRLDNHFLSSLHNTLTKVPEIKNHIKYFSNTSLYRIGNKYRYIEIEYKQSGRSYKIAEVEYSNYLNKIISIAQAGVKIKDLTDILVNKDISLKDAEDFIQKVIDSQIIVPVLDQTVVGDDLFQRILDLLESIKSINPSLLNNLKKIKNILSQLDSESRTHELYQQILEIIRFQDIPYEEKYLFQVDMIRKPIRATLSRDIISELESSITLLNKLTPFFRNEELRQFQERFYMRYEDREVSLFEALDPDIGIGYPSIDGTLSPLIDHLILPQNTAQNVEKNKLHSILLKRVTEVSNNNKLEIELSDKDVEGLVANWDDLPTTISVLFEIVQADSDKLLIKLQSCGGSSAANLIARFAHTDDSIEQYVKDIVSKEQDLEPDAILAEIIHSPEARIGNILFRPHIREYELLFISDSDLPREQIILLSDIMISVRNNQIILRSKKLNKEIIPRLTSAHNYHHFGTMSIYRFLCDMQIQAKRGSLHFNWDQRLDRELSFFPRVRYKNTILSLATWRVWISEIKSLFDIQENRKLLDEAQIWREKRFLPRYTLLPDGDNELLIDWENILSIKSFFSVIKSRQEIKLTEFLFTPETSIVRRSADNKPFTNECIVTFYKKMSNETD